MSTLHPTHLLVPVDLSDASRSGLRVAAEISRRFESELTVLHVEATSAAIADAFVNTEGLSKRVLEATRGAVKRFVRETLGDDSGVNTAVVRNAYVAQTIIHFAHESGADWICIGATGRGALDRTLLGSTAAKVVRLAPVPVLTLRATRPDGQQFLFDDFRRVLVATDLGDGADRLIELGGLLAHPHGALQILHVIESPGELGLYGVPLTIPAENINAAMEWTRSTLDSKLQGIEAGTVEPPRVVTGRAIDVLLETERELQPDVTIIGTHGRCGIERLTLGSVAESFIQRATGPVLVVPTSEETAN